MAIASGSMGCFQGDVLDAELVGEGICDIKLGHQLQFDKGDPHPLAGPFLLLDRHLKVGLGDQSGRAEKIANTFFVNDGSFITFILSEDGIMRNLTGYGEGGYFP